MPVERNRPCEVHPGDVLKIGVTRCGQRCNLAVRGGIDVPEYLGSRSTFTLGRFGGHGGLRPRGGRCAPHREDDRRGTADALGRFAA